MSGSQAPERTPATLRWAVRLLLVEGAGLAAVTLWLIYLDLTSDAASVPGAVSVTVYLALMTVCFLGVGLALQRRRRWARGPGIVVSMLQMPIPLWYALLTTAFALLLGYPLAYAIALKAGRWKNVLLICVIAPFFTSFPDPHAGLKVILSDNGTVVSGAQRAARPAARRAGCWRRRRP
ncbi:hypothetical protein GCM10020218_074390 [Dactylosporangium vinaceum]